MLFFVLRHPIGEAFKVRLNIFHGIFQFFAYGFGALFHQSLGELTFCLAQLLEFLL
ncbi:hypothetical protein EVA_06054 [gut metagenome]|uniref:Uncharacterized protein n=1 Tax=gut metagenome TaxID=749906 RepID=J9GES0_9ZZZZ